MGLAGLSSGQVDEEEVPRREVGLTPPVVRPAIGGKSRDQRMPPGPRSRSVSFPPEEKRDAQIRRATGRTKGRRSDHHKLQVTSWQVASFHILLLAACNLVDWHNSSMAFRARERGADLAYFYLRPGKICRPTSPGISSRSWPRCEQHKPNKKRGV